MPNLRNNRVSPDLNVMETIEEDEVYTSEHREQDYQQQRVTAIATARQALTMWQIPKQDAQIPEQDAHTNHKMSFIILKKSFTDFIRKKMSKKVHPLKPAPISRTVTKSPEERAMDYWRALSGEYIAPWYQNEHYVEQTFSRLSPEGIYFLRIIKES